MVSTDKSNAKKSKLSKYLNKAVDVGVTGGISAIPGAAPVAKGAGKITGELVEKLISEHEKSKQHKEGKLIEHLLKTFQPEDREWIMFLLDSFSTIFIWLVPFDYLITRATLPQNTLLPKKVSKQLLIIQRFQRSPIPQTWLGTFF